ncbi:FGGY carbohydrate kinase domain-containing protein [Nasonia vitripennis]|uniref:FGGY carbohydrate kinase domain-containing protein n=1 Tax=Nasonia vitripennis TaxID=7425 RepID=A0A7M7PZV2_NASVI|nr:FGGY carbohydrate kinase domain-containing protein [Nasonia vitripennis]XP_008214393.1 FGGY carbohydrate kinase domain-containing protein [Nasonia vitripennis]XP_008214394.1 FGGY carbohydrate kinase domain-containing protein [Nasonia vitripennis]XP_031779599.1 FGGY carbohydrate kinase domain-containing protein [Nasonia vitripennis]XP_032452512.1 FGGY carbohydrate kinase domain-containing protein [Nasonia vitripennis]
MDYFVGVDVGTGSVRAALVTSQGKIVATAVKPTKTFNPKAKFYEQSSDDIWSSVCQVVKKVIAKTPKDRIKGIGFDATCSLVAIDKNGLPVTVSPTGNDEQNIILWMDHRAQEQADYINKLGHKMLKYVGGKVSLEMEVPKLLWLKNNLPDSWRRAALFFDLPDFLTWKATNSESRSLCSLVCKWNFSAGPNGDNHWCADFFDEIGLSDLQSNNWKKIGQDVKPPGHPVGLGLTARAAEELDLLEGTPVGTSIIDAHAGGLGMLGCSAPQVSPEFTSRLGLICGTSTCHMAVSKDEIFVDGVWGPYYGAMVPDLWLNEGGQSTTGKLIDHIIDSHPASLKIKNSLPPNVHIQKYLSDLLSSMASKKKLSDIAYLTEDVHVWPDFHGNRSPLADPTLHGMICGLTLATDEESLATLYLATMQSLTYGTKHILEALTDAGHKIESLLVCGGLSQNPLFIQTQADVLGLPVLCPVERESVLVGSAILGSCAAKTFSSVHEAIKVMGGSANVVNPITETYSYHSKKYQVFKKMVKDQQVYKKYMSSK